MEYNFLEERRISIGLRVEVYVERCSTTTIDVCGDEIFVDRFVVQG